MSVGLRFGFGSALFLLLRYSVLDTRLGYSILDSLTPTKIDGGVIVAF